MTHACIGLGVSELVGFDLIKHVQGWEFCAWWFLGLIVVMTQGKYGAGVSENTTLTLGKPCMAGVK